MQILMQCPVGITHTLDSAFWREKCLSACLVKEDLSTRYLVRQPGNLAILSATSSFLQMLLLLLLKHW